MRRFSLELLDPERLLVDVGEEPARGLAVEADRRDQRVAARDLPRPRGRVVLFPVVPALDGWVAPEATLWRRELAGHRMQWLRRSRVPGAPDSGTRRPALTPRAPADPKPA